MLLWLVTGAALLQRHCCRASAAASVIERRTEIGLMKALGAGSGTVAFCSRRSNSCWHLLAAALAMRSDYPGRMLGRKFLVLPRAFAHCLFRVIALAAASRCSAALCRCAVLRITSRRHLRGE